MPYTATTPIREIAAVSMPRLLARLPAALAAAPLLLLTPAGVSAQARTLTLTPDSAAPLTLAVSADAYRLRFDLTQLGADSATIEVACAGMGAVACVSAPARTLRLGPSEGRVIEVAYRATRPGRGLVVLRARDPRSGTRAIATLLVTVLGS